MANPSFEITSTNVTPPPVSTFYTPASWVAPSRCYADYGWLRPDGIGHIGLYGTGTSIAYQNVPVTVGNAYTLTLYSAMHFPLVNSGQARLQYYDSSNNPIASAAIHTVFHDWEDDNGFGGPYTISLAAAPSNASYVRVTLENLSPTASGESVKFDALCLTSSTLSTCCTGTNILTNASAENGTYTANASVVDANNANNNAAYNSDITNWERNGNVRWVTDGGRATDGNRFVYLPTQGQCFTRLFSLGTGVSTCKTYKICLDIAAFDDTQPNGGTSTSGFVLEGTYWNTGFTNSQEAFKITNFTDVSTGTTVSNPMTISSWNNIQWKRITATFSIPTTTLANASNFKLYLSNALNTYVNSDGKGLLIDNVCLTEVPNPAPTVCDVVVNPIRICAYDTPPTTPDAEGRVFESRLKYNLEGTRVNNSNTITNINTGSPNGTSSQALYQRAINENYMDWHFAVPNGSYTIVLHYAETVFTAANKRVFDVFIDGTQVENNFDIYVAAGNAANKAIVKQYTTTVTGNDLEVQFKPEIDNPQIVAIEILPNFCVATQSVSINNASVSGCYLNNNQSKATVNVEVAWNNALPTDSIKVVLNAQTRWIYPGQYNTTGSVGTIRSPQVVAFEIVANGLSRTISAQMFNNTNCPAATTNITAPSACPVNTCATGNLGGTVFNDYNADGIHQAGETAGTSGVTVNVFDCTGSLVATTTSDINGVWSVSTALNYPVRVEFSNLPAYVGANGTPNGTNGRTTTQFVNAASCSVDLGVLNQTDYCQSTPDIFIPCYVNGDPLPGGSAAGAMDAFIRLPYGSSGLTPSITHVASAAEVGTLWGVAYDKKRNKVYTSAVLRRHAGLGSLGLGGIYTTNAATNATTTLVDVQATLGIDVGSKVSGDPFFGQTNIARGLLTDPTQPSHDSLAFTLIGKIGIGDLEISENSNFLYFTNLYDKKLYKLDITGASPTLSGSYTIPSNCTNGVSRPFGLKVKNGKVYVGAVCDGSTSQSPSDMRAYVYALDETAGTFSTVYDFPLTYPKGFADHGVISQTTWNTWTENFQKINTQTFDTKAYRAIYPQPILSDIEIDLDGSLILSFADRTALQMGFMNYQSSSTDTKLYKGFSGGDILRAAYKNGTYLLESNAYVGGITGSSPNNDQGPGFGEFYNDDFYTGGNLAHSEIALGALALRPGSGQALFTVMDPIDSTINSGGFRYISNSTGLSPLSKSKGAMVYQTVVVANSTPATFGKSVGLGDMELNCGSVTYLQVGNYVWQDTNKDGVQDPCEPPLSNVTVTLWKGGTQIASTTTNSSGEYYFSDKNAAGVTWTGTGADTTLLPTTAYEVRIDTSNQSAFIKLALTTANSTANNGNDQNDNDAVTTGKYKVISFTTGAVGSVNHTYDFGFYPFCDTTLVVTNTTICNGSTVDLFTLASGVKGTLSYSTNGTTWTDLTSPTNVTPSVTTTYYIKDTLVSGCFDIDTLVITVNPTPTTPSVSSPITNICPLTTVDLTVISSALTPSVSGGVFEWHVSNSSGSALVSNPNDVVAGDYYLFERSPAGCYSIGKKVTVAIQVCCPPQLCIPVTITRTN